MERTTSATAGAPAEVWAQGEAYESYVGRWSRPVARAFLAWLEPPAGARWLDLGCGSGALSRSIREACAPASLWALDRSQGFVRYARSADAGAHGFVVADALALPLRPGALDFAVSGLMLNFLSSPADALAELRRVLRPGGVAAAYVWDYAGRMELLRHFWDAAVALDPGAAALDEGTRFPICSPEPLAKLFAASGLEEVQVQAIDVPTRFRDFEDCWTPFLGGQGPAPGYVASLRAQQRVALRDALRERLPRAADDTIALLARAWAARGRVPWTGAGA